MYLYKVFVKIGKSKASLVTVGENDNEAESNALSLAKVLLPFNKKDKIIEILEARRVNFG